MKKCISLLMVILLMFSVVFCVPVSAASNTDGEFYYELSYDDTYYILYDTISEIKGDVVIPEEFNGLPVKEIDNWAFNSCSEITSVTINDNIKKINENAFVKCKKLNEVNISDEVEYIHATAFDNTAFYDNYANWVLGALYAGKHLIRAKTDISGAYQILDGTASIAEEAFKGCDMMETVIIPESVSAIHDRTFEDCLSLEYVYISEGVASIGMDVFSRTALRYIHFPSTLKSIGECALPSMTAIYVPANVTDIDSWAIHSSVGMIYGEADSAIQKHAEYEELPFTDIAKHTHNTKDIELFEASLHSPGVTYNVCEDCGQIFDCTIKDQKTPTEVTLKEIKNTEIGVFLSWKNVTGADYYLVFRKASGEDEWTAIGVVDSTACYDVSTKNNKKYSYRVAAVNEGGLSDFGDSKLTIKFVTMPEITGLTNNTAGVKITWKRVKYADRYYLYRFDESSGEWKRIKRISSGKTTSYVDENVKSGKRYYYRIKAYNDGYLSGDVGGGAPAIERLSRPKLDSVKSTKKGVKFTWKKVTGAEGYVVYRKTGSKGDWKAIKTIEGGSKVSYTDKTAKKGKTYYYSVRATKYGFNSAYNTKGLRIKDKY